MKKIIFILLASFLCIGWANAQEGLEDIVVEIFYISDANDATADEAVIEGSYTYRVFADMAPDWELQAIYAENNPADSKLDTLRIESTEPFFNNEDRGETFGYNIGTNRLDDGTVMIDSYLSTGRTSEDTEGVLKDEDTDGAIENGDGFLQNDDPIAGTPISELDGNIASTSTVTFTPTPGFEALLEAVFGEDDQAGNSLVTGDAALGLTVSLQGPTADNRVLIGQFTTHGEFSFELNLQLRNIVTNEVQQWVAKTPQADQFSIPALIFPLNIPPTAEFTATPTSGSAPLTVDVDAEASEDADGTITSYDWDFGDGNTDTGVTASNVYNTPGTYTITLTVTDDNGATATATETITVSEPPNMDPVASFTATPTSGDAPLNVIVDATASSDADGTIASYAWDFGNGTTGTGVMANPIYNMPGTYTVTLTVTDDDGATDVATTTITVTETPNMPPVASFSATPTSGNAPLAVAVDGAASSDPDGTIVTYSWDFGNGTMGSGATASTTYTAAGSYTITLTVTDNDGASNIATQIITVTTPPPPNMAPTAAFTATPTSGTAPLAVSVDGSASSDSDGTIASYEWDFGNGTMGSGATANTTYTTAGTYTITLTVTDNDGATGTATETITVSEPTANEAPTADFTVSPTTGTIPLVVNFDASVSSDSDGTITSYAWDFGDGNSGTGVSPTHTYMTTGVFTATLTVTDNDGATATATATIATVQPGVDGLEGIDVEIFYVADANDASAAEGVVEGAVTYRVYVDMAQGWEFQALYGENFPAENKVDVLKIESTEPFFNNEDRGETFGYNIGANRLSEGTVMLDSYFSTGRTSEMTAGVLKDEDTDGAIANADGYLQNNDPLAGTPINVNDGNIASASTVTFDPTPGFESVLDAVFGNTDQGGNSLVTNNAALGLTQSLQGPNAENRVLIGQFTTHGQFCFELNVQLRNMVSSEVQQWVAQTPQADQFSMDDLIFCSNAAPIADFTATPTTGTAPLDVAVDASASSDSDGMIVSYEWDFGNGSQGTGVNANTTYATAGTYTITLTVTDNDGATATATETITVEDPINEAPTAAFTADPTSGTAPLAVSFDASASSDSDGTITSYSWDFGDGNTGTGMTTTHTYMTVGTFTATLTVTDNSGATDATSVSIEVTPGAGTASVQFIHAAPFENVRIEVDGVDYGEFYYKTATDYLDVPAGMPVNVEFIPTSIWSDSPSESTVFTFTPDESHVVVLYGTLDDTDTVQSGVSMYTGAQQTVNDDDIGLLLFHASPDQSSVDVVTGGNVLFEDVEYGTFNDQFTLVPDANYIIDLTPTGEPTNILYKYDLNIDWWNGKSATLFAIGYEDIGTFEVWVALSTGGTFPLNEIITAPPGAIVNSESNNSLSGQDNSLFIYPNPVSDVLFTTVQLTKDSRIDLGIYDARGQQMMNIFEGTQKEGVYQYEINTKGLPAGMYYFKMNSVDGQQVKPIAVIR